MPSSLQIQGPKTLLYFCQTLVMIPPIAASPEVSFCLCLAILDQLLLLRCKLFPHVMLSAKSYPGDTKPIIAVTPA